VPEPEIKPKIIKYNTQLKCPDNHVQALATALHYPNKTCLSAVMNAESKIDSAHYMRACITASTKYTQKRPKILDAAVFTCTEKSGAVIDVAVCCSTILPKNRKMHALKVPTDIWEVIRTNDIFALKLLLSRQPERHCH